MNEALAYCGLVCQTCPIYLATREKNATERRRMRTAIARLCREHYGMEYTPEDISDCDGCRTENGRLFTACRSCAVRKCARQRGLENCAFCSEYVCDRLEAIFNMDPAARKRLDELRE